ncbi:MAG: hypothetical protein JXA18_01145 [Chitinispirillaceae bacterium]|nr:hypothetical protein [Chitinispirillaceae bacterium]
MDLRGCGLTLIVAAAVAFGAQEQQAEPNFYPHNIGAGAGFSTGLGLSYRHWFENTYGLQINFIPFVSEQGEYYNRFISVGLTGLKILRQARMVNLFGYVGVHGLYHNERFEETDEVSEEPGTGIYHEKSTTCFIGLGPGIDIHFWKLSINAMAGIAGRFAGSDDWAMQMSGETALYYTF